MMQRLALVALFGIIGLCAGQICHLTSGAAVSTCPNLCASTDLETQASAAGEDVTSATGKATCIHACASVKADPSKTCDVIIGRVLGLVKIAKQTLKYVCTLTGSVGAPKLQTCPDVCASAQLKAAAQTENIDTSDVQNQETCVNQCATVKVNPQQTCSAVVHQTLGLLKVLPLKNGILGGVAGGDDGGNGGLLSGAGGLVGGVGK